MHWVHCIMAKLVGFWIVVSRINASLRAMSYYFPFIVGIILFMSCNSWSSKIKGAKSNHYLTYKAIVLQRTQQSTLQETLLLQSWNSCSKAYLKILGREWLCTTCQKDKGIEKDKISTTFLLKYWYYTVKPVISIKQSLSKSRKSFPLITVKLTCINWS